MSFFVVFKLNPLHPPLAKKLKGSREENPEVRPRRLLVPRGVREAGYVLGERAPCMDRSRKRNVFAHGDAPPHFIVQGQGRTRYVRRRKSILHFSNAPVQRLWKNVPSCKTAGRARSRLAPEAVDAGCECSCFVLKIKERRFGKAKRKKIPPQMKTTIFFFE